MRITSRFFGPVVLALGVLLVSVAHKGSLIKGSPRSSINLIQPVRQAVPTICGPDLVTVANACAAAALAIPCPGCPTGHLCTMTCYNGTTTLVFTPTAPSTTDVAQFDLCSDIGWKMDVYRCNICPCGAGILIESGRRCQYSLGTDYGIQCRQQRVPSHGGGGEVERALTSTDRQRSGERTREGEARLRCGEREAAGGNVGEHVRAVVCGDGGAGAIADPHA